MHDHSNFFARLTLTVDADERAVKRAYAREVKLIDQENDAAGFQQLRGAYEAALLWVAQGRELPLTEPEQLASAPEVNIAQVAMTTSTQDARPVPDAQTPPTPEQVHPHQLANPVFMQFCDAGRQLDVPKEISDEDVWRNLLSNSLADGRLFNIAAREFFEFRIAELLASGWRRGHESLWVAACDAFNWNQDQRRLLGLGRAGALLNQASDERAMFFQQTEAERVQQARVLKRLRKPGAPGVTELIRLIPIVNKMVALFPTWLPLIVDKDTVIEWLRLDQQVPKWRRRLTFQWKKTANPAPAKPSNWRYVFGAMAVISVLRVAMNNNGAPTAPPAQLPSLPYTVPAPRHTSSLQWSTPEQTRQQLSEKEQWAIFGRMRYSLPAGAQGMQTVEYEVLLDPSGNIRELNKINASAYADLDIAYANAIRQSQPFAADLSRHFHVVLRQSKPARPAASATAAAAFAEAPATTASARMRAREQSAVISANIHYQLPADALGTQMVSYEVELDKIGNVAKVHKLKKSDYPDFDAAVADAIRQSQPYPAALTRKFSFSSTISNAQPKNVRPADASAPSKDSERNKQGQIDAAAQTPASVPAKDD